jgi:hypothetical protein
MSDMVQYSIATTPNPVTEYRQSINTPDFEGLPNTLINPNLSAVVGNPIKYWKHVAGAIQLMTQGERDAVDASIAAALLLARRTGGKDYIDSVEALGIILRAVADITKDELNILRQWLAAFKVEVAAASNLADLKTRVATLPATADRTLAQLKTAIKNKIDGGTLDS